MAESTQLRELILYDSTNIVLQLENIWRLGHPDIGTCQQICENSEH